MSGHLKSTQRPPIDFRQYYSLENYQFPNPHHPSHTFAPPLAPSPAPTLFHPRPTNIGSAPFGGAFSSKTIGHPYLHFAALTRPEFDFPRAQAILHATTPLARPLASGETSALGRGGGGGGDRPDIGKGPNAQFPRSSPPVVGGGVGPSQPPQLQPPVREAEGQQARRRDRPSSWNSIQFFPIERARTIEEDQPISGGRDGRNAETRHTRPEPPAREGANDYFLPPSARWEEKRSLPVSGLRVYRHSGAIAKLVPYDGRANLRLHRETDMFLLLSAGDEIVSPFIPRLNLDRGELGYFLHHADDDADDGDEGKAGLRNPTRRIKCDFSGYGTLEDFFNKRGGGPGWNAPLAERMEIRQNVVRAVLWAESEVRCSLPPPTFPVSKAR